MDDFGLDRQEFTGSLISMEFGSAGRIQQMWVGDPTLPEDSEEFQFVCPPLNMGEEITEDYFPGTILLGARMGPNEPWVLSRNIGARTMSDEEEEGFSAVSFEYEMSFLEDLRANGRYFEIPGQAPQIAWDVEITNDNRSSIEIGELAFPLALNNVYEGFPRGDQGIQDLCRDRLFVHPYVGGAASHIFAQRMNGRPPGLVIFPGEDTRWEFFNHVPASLTTPYRWEGIPVVYVHSQAAIEREGWPEWFLGHTSIILEPGESRTYHTRFVSASRFMGDNVLPALAACGRPAIRLFPAAVAPADVGIAIEVSGTTPTRFDCDVDVELETDADENGGFCFVRPKEPGAVKITFEDVQERESELHLLLTEPIEDLLQKRADWILAHQVVNDGGPLDGAIVPANIDDGTPLTDPEYFGTPFGIESGLADALFLAEKNTIYPVAEQIATLDRYLTSFLEDRVLNPGDGSLGCLLPNPGSVAAHTGRSSLYPIVFLLYDAMARIAEGYGTTARPISAYQGMLAQVARSMGDTALGTEGDGVPLMSHVLRRWGELTDAGFGEGSGRSAFSVQERLAIVQRRKYPFGGESLWSTTGFEESFYAARRQRSPEQMERVLRYAYACRSLAPCWWWYASDKRWSEEPVSLPHPAMPDKGEMCLGPTSVANSLIFLQTLDRDDLQVDETLTRMAFGGLLGIWALVRSDGAAGMGFCPDASSRQFGMSWTTGDVGIGLYHYMREVASFVLPSRTTGIQSFGCRFDIENEGGNESYIVRPWDGIGRRVVVRHVNLEARVRNARIQEARFDGRKRNATFALQNPSDRELLARLEVRGLWGQRFTVGTQPVDSSAGRLVAEVAIPAGETTRIEVRVRE